VGWLVDEIASDTRGIGPDLAQARALADSRLVASIGLHHGERLDDLVTLLLEVAVEAVRAQDGALDDGLGALPRRQTVARDEDGRAGGAEITRAPDRRRSPTADGLGISRLPLAETDDEDAAGGDAPSGMEMGDLPRLALEALTLEHVGEEPSQLLVQRGQFGDRARGIARTPDDQHVA